MSEGVWTLTDSEFEQELKKARMDVAKAVMALHNDKGERLTGGIRADRWEHYCTECNKAAPCPTVIEVSEALRKPLLG